MGGINQYLKERLEEMGDRTLIAPNIPADKLSNAVNAFKYDGDPSSVIGVCDNTMFKSAKEGILLSGSKLIYKGVFEAPVEVSYEDIYSAEHVISVDVSPKGKEKKSESLIINKKDGEVLELKHFGLIDLAKLAEIVNGAVANFDGYIEQSQLQPIEELSEDLKVAYMKIIINMAFDNYGRIGGDEFAEILQLMTRLNCTVESRNELRGYTGSSDNAESVESLLQVINSNAPDGMRKSLHISLVKDLISVNASLTKGDFSDFEFLRKYRDDFDVSDEEIELAQMAITNDRKIMDRAYTDSIITKSLKELSAKAGAVGVPLGAVYLSGSVMGLSAAGMTSGLATLGMGGILGLSSMATGIGTAVILGVVAYKGIRHLTGSGVDEGDKRREILLQEVIRQSQRAINMAIEDINHLSRELSSALMAEHVTKEQLNQIAAKFSQYISASKVISKKAEQAEADRARLRSPEFLDVARLKALTQEHDKKKYFDFVMNFYKEDVLLEEKDDEPVEKNVLRLVQSRDSREMEELGQIFELLGYATTQGAIKGKLKEMFS